MKHNTDYKFSDNIKCVMDFHGALELDYAVGIIEKRLRNNRLDCYILTVHSGNADPSVQYEIYDLEDCLKITTSRVDFMHHLIDRGYLVVDR